MRDCVSSDGKMLLEVSTDEEGGTIYKSRIRISADNRLFFLVSFLSFGAKNSQDEGSPLLRNLAAGVRVCTSARQLPV